ncbi:hypothetical protein [Modicisalibacter xianhensis]|uniref:Uncharacterized protein n=1 Tax=Modicisalibacter xianhensis TaxID=442341 RepID=A0A1I3EML2_9GAMM|nr:hypothetical protein [Halomonas xianhensis]SFI00265.1 hypothetical protein SAMN04487959_11460 [Halomonas xianhensis]
MKTIEAVLHRDANSDLAWLQLPKPIVKGLGIDHRLSRQNRTDDRFIYLRDRPDARLVELVLEDKLVELSISEQVHEDDDWVERLAHYRPELLGDSVEYLEDQLIELPRADELNAQTICKYAEHLQDRAQRYCNVMLPEHEWVANLLEFKDGANEVYSLCQVASFSNTVGLMTESRRGNCEGYVCTAYLTRLLPHAGLVAVPLVSGKFWSWDEADRLSRKIQDWCR